MSTQIARPRQIAQKLITAFVDNKEASRTNPDDAEPLHEQAKTLARNVAALIVYHARRHRGDQEYIVPSPIWPLVKRYEASRGKK